MRETNFIKQNKKKWFEFENILSLKKKDPDKLSNLFIEITDDLSYSQTFYSNRMVRVYLNGVAQSISNSLYKTRKFKFRKFITFWKDDLPQLVYESKREFILSFVVFAIAMLIGILSSANDSEFPRIILGDAYVNMTIENIKNNDPMAVYKQANELDMTLGITVNNLRVAFMTFVFGALFAGGTVYILLFNGVMVGTFQYFFYERGVFTESFLTIWQHGTLEIASIIIAGAAGLVLGKGLVFPGTLSRLQAFQISARKGMKIMIGITPIIIFAGIIESFITRHTEAPLMLRIFVILFSLTCINGYFVWYPVMKKREGFKQKLTQRKLPPSLPRNIDFKNIKSNAEVFTDTFVIYKRYLSPIFYIALIISTLYSIAALFMSHQFEVGLDLSWAKLNFLFELFKYSDSWLLYAINTVIFACVAMLSYFFITKEEENGILKQGASLWDGIFNFIIKRIMPSVIIIAIANLIFITHAAIQIILFIFVMPLVILWLFVVNKEQKGIFSGGGRMFVLIEKSYSNILVLNIMFLFLVLFLYFLFQTPIMGLFLEIIEMNLLVGEEALLIFHIILLTFTTTLGLCMILPLLFISIGLEYYSLLEITEAKHLRYKLKLNYQ